MRNGGGRRQHNGLPLSSDSDPALIVLLLRLVFETIQSLLAKHTDLHAHLSYFRVRTLFRFYVSSRVFHIADIYTLTYPSSFLHMYRPGSHADLVSTPTWSLLSMHSLVLAL